MKLELKIFGSLCSTEEFKINDVTAHEEHFGKCKDLCPSNDYGCGDLQFIPIENPDEKILKRYNITKEEYSEVCEKLKKGLSFGSCGWCI